MPEISFADAVKAVPAPKEISFAEATAGRPSEEPGFLDHMGNLLSNSPMIGTISPEMVPSSPGTQLAIGAYNSLYNAPVTFFRERMMDESLRNLPDNQAELQRLKVDRGIAGQIIGEAQKPDNAAGQLVGDALQSIPGSVASVVPFAAGMATAPAVAAGLGANYMMETAGDYVHRRDELKQSPEDAEIPAHLHGGVATALEALPMGVIAKHFKGGQSIAKTLGKLGLGEAAQEGGTQVYDDLSTNFQGLTNISFAEGAANAAKAAATGAIMAPMMGTVLKPVQMAQEYGVKKQLEKSFVQVQRENFEAQEAPARFQRSIEEALTLPTVSTVPMTPAEERTATIVREQLRNGLDVPPVVSQSAVLVNEVVGNLFANGDISVENSPVLDEGGVTPEVFARRQRDYVAMEGTADTWPIIASRDPKVTGMTLGQIGELPAGSVTVIGRDDDNWPGSITQATMDTTGEWVDKFLPGSRVVILQVPFSENHDTAMGWHQMQLTDAGPIHFIIPRDMPNIGRHQTSDHRTALNMVGGFTHEFGHAVEQQGFWEVLTERVGPQLAQQFYGETLTGNFTDATLAALGQAAPQEVALAQNWAEQRSRMLDGTMLAREYLETWAGVRKSGAGVAVDLPANKSLYHFAEQRAKEMGRPLDGMTAKELLLGKPTAQHTIGDMKEMLRQTSFSEYMAEQFTRAAYAKGYLANSPLGQMFQRTLNRLRELFRFLKTAKNESVEPLIAAHVTFQDWLDGITARAAKMKKPKGTVKLTAKAKAAQKKILEQKALAKEVDELVMELEGEKEQAPPPEQVPPSKEDQHDPQGPTLMELVTAATDPNTGWIEPGSMEEARLHGMVKRGKIEQVMEILDNGHFDKVQAARRYASRVFSLLPNKEQIKRETIQATLRRAELKEAEKKAWEEILTENQGKTLSREELAQAIQGKMIPLAAKNTERYAYFGLENIGRIKNYPRVNADTGVVYTPPGGPDNTVTTLWRLPDFMLMSDANHFNDPQLFGHTRSFEEGGIRHVVEIQSDLMQHAKGGLPEEQRPAALARLVLLEDIRETDQATFKTKNKNNQSLQALLYKKVEDAGFDIAQPMEEIIKDVWLELDELRVKLEATAISSNLSPIIKNWEQRLIKEELARAATNGQMKIRFASADTVAKVEGWSRVMPNTPANRALQNLLQATVESGTREEVDKLMEVTRARSTEFIDPGHQSIYNRYAGDITKYLKSLGGVSVTDTQGHTWIEVPVLPTMEELFHWDKTNPVQPRLPEVGVVDFAGLTNEELMKPEMVSLASMMYKSQGTNSPFFLRWYRDGVRDREAQPLKVFRGSHSKITFLDRESLGYHTGAEDATKAFWASDSLNNASYYAEGSALSKHPVVKEAYRREQQQLRKAVNQAREMLRTKTDLTKGQRQKLWNALGAAEADLEDFLNEPGKNVSASPSISELYLRLENPLTKDAEGASYDEILWTEWVDEAVTNGHDGLIIKRALDPRPGTVYAFFKPEQAKDLANVGTFDDTDRLHWDRDQPAQNTAASTVDSLKGWLDLKWQQGLNLAAKASDSLVQLQQTAAAQPEEAFLNGFVGLLRRSSQMASDLQFPAEETVAKMIRSTPHTVNELQRIMTNEWKGGILMGELQGLDENGQVVWGADVGRGPENLQNAIDWRVADSIGLREFLTKEGVDVESAAGEKIIELYLGVRNTFLHQFRGLEIALREKASRAYGNAPLVLRQEYFKIDQLISKYRILPFLPQGHFGNHVVLVMKKRSWEEAKADNRRRFVTVRRMHFESKAEADKAFIEMKKLEAGGEYRVRTRVLDDSRYGIPMQLPREFLENVAATGEFDDDQIDLLADLMVTGKYERIEAKYDKISEKVTGGNEDFKRVFSNFTWHNANYVWKTYYRSAMQNMLSMARTEVRQLERSALPAEQIVKLVGKKRRNIRMMESSLNYIMHPENELQGMKLMITLTYLAFNVKTAVMNLSTQLNTFAALGTEYGEWKGANLYKKGLWYTANAFRLTQMSGEGKTASEKEAMDVRSMIDQAVRQGVLDQSYAYFLAGQANAGGSLSVSSNSWLGRVAHVAMEGGMLPFRLTEKANRYSTLISFYLAERGQGIDGVRAYETAVKKVDLLQNSYSQGNRPELFRGKKGIFFMFASFAQFQGWVMTGGYERSARAGAKAEGRNVRSVWAGTTMKLWLFYLMLGGGLGLPFAENILDLAKFVWRRLFGNPENLEVELRAFIKDLGGDPNLALHGLFHNFLGFNLSGSFGLGRLLPFTDVLNRQFSSVDAAIGKGVTSFAGPAGNFYGSVLAALGQLAQGEPLEAMKEMPGAIGAVGKTADAIIRQNLTPGEGMGVRLKNGTRLTKDPETGEFRDLTGVELAGMAMSAVPALVAENRQLAFAQQGEVLYWNMRRQELKEKYRHARMEGDEKATDIWRDKIDQFNETIPDHNLRITGKELAEGVKAQRKSARAMENYGTMQKKMRGVVGEVGEGY